MSRKLSGCVSSVVMEVEMLGVTTMLLAGTSRLGVPVTIHWSDDVVRESL